MDGDRKRFWRDEPEESESEYRARQRREMGLRPMESSPGSIESFVPTDEYRSKIRRAKRRHARRRRTLWAILILVGVVIVGIGGVYAYRLNNDPGSFFKPSSTPETAVIIIEETGTASMVTPTPAPTITPDPWDVLYQQADLSMMQDIVNILIIGVDYSDERETWNGKHEYHADVMMVMAINFDENRVDLISMPRDTYANIPGIRGIYKLNASLNCGGGFEAANGAGFLKCCETASWMLGGMPVPYYYAVTMPAVKQLVDTVGGVDYDMELAFTMAGRQYRKGVQHLDGQGVLDYMRVRKNVQSSGDLNRINRQKKMLVALFNTMKQQNLLLKIPDIVSSFNGQLYTNCTLEQTMALTVFASKYLSDERIGMYSMGGTMKNIFNWNFCITDQKNRVDIINKVYGVQKPQYPDYTLAYAQYLWADMVAEAYLKTTKSFAEHLKGVSSDTLLGLSSQAPPVGGSAPGGTPVVIAPSPSTGFSRRFMPPRAILGENEMEDPEGDAPGPTQYSPQISLYEMYFAYPKVIKEIETLREEAAIQAQRYVEDKKNSLKDCTEQLNEQTAILKAYTLELAAALGYSSSRFNWTYRYDKDPAFNEITVDFR